MTDSRRRDDDPWRAATWEGAERAALRAGAALSLPERLRWLEQSAELARRLGGEAPGPEAPVSSGSEAVDEVAEPAARTSGAEAVELGVTLLELLDRLGGAQVELRRSDATLSAALLRVADGRRIFVIERTYREGLRVLLDPEPGDLETIRNGDLWSLWSSGRLRWLGGAV